MGVAIGIDLGTTNSVAAIKRGDVRVIQSREGEDLVPSVVGFHKDQILVGRRALDRLASSPKETIISIKRLMGRAFNDPEVQHVKSRYRYQVVPPSNGTEDDVRVILGGKEYSPIEISSFILKKIREDVAMRLNLKLEEVEYAVITVPAYFNERQREATLRAGQLAGFKVQCILDEPTAAAIAYGVDNVGVDDSRTVVVYDLGGGTFDISVLTIVGGVFSQERLEGDMWMGGDDFDWKLMQHVVNHVKDVHGIDPSSNDRFMASLKIQAQKAKETLSSLSRTDITLVSQLQDSDGNMIDIEMEITREQLERLIAREVASSDGHRVDVERSFELVKLAMEGAGRKPDQIDHILLVGGSSNIPIIRNRLVQLFGEKKIHMNVDAMKCVAYGAAILAASYGEKWTCANKHINPGTEPVCQEPGCGEVAIHKQVVSRITAEHYGIQATGDKFEIIIPKGSSYPSPEPVTRNFKTTHANVRRLRVPVYAGMENVASKNQLQQTVWLELPPNLPSATRVDVALKLSSDGILDSIKVKLHDGTGREVEVFRDRGGERRSRLEKKIELIRKKIDENYDRIPTDIAPQAETLYDEVILAISERMDLDAAERKLSELDKLVAVHVEPNWKRDATNVLQNVEFGVREFGTYLKPEDGYKIRKVMDEMQAALDKDDQTLTAAKQDELMTLLKGNWLVYWLTLLILGINKANALGDAVSADALKRALRDSEEAIRRNDVATLDQIINRANPIMDKVFGGKGVVGPRETGVESA